VQLLLVNDALRVVQKNQKQFKISIVNIFSLVNFTTVLFVINCFCCGCCCSAAEGCCCGVVELLAAAVSADAVVVFVFAGIGAGLKGACSTSFSGVFFFVCSSRKKNFTFTRPVGIPLSLY